MSGKKENRRMSILKPNEENNGESVNKPKRRVSFHTHRIVKEYDHGDNNVNRTPQHESMHFSGSSEERSSFFRPSSTLPNNNTQASEGIHYNDTNNLTSNTTANATIGFFNRMEDGNGAKRPDTPDSTGLHDQTLVQDQTLAFFNKLKPMVDDSPLKQIQESNSDNTLFAMNKIISTTKMTTTITDHTLAMMNKLIPSTPETPVHLKRVSELAHLLLDHHESFTSPTSDKFPKQIDPEASKVFEACDVSPIKDLHKVDLEQPKKLNFDAEMEIETPVSKKHGPQTPGKQFSSKMVAETPKPMDSTYVVEVQMEVDKYTKSEQHMEVDGYAKDTHNSAISEDANNSCGTGTFVNKTYVLERKVETDYCRDVSMTSPDVSDSYVAYKPSEKVQKSIRRLSGIVQREKRRSLLSSFVSSESNSPANFDEAQQQKKNLYQDNEKQKSATTTTTTTTTHTHVSIKSTHVEEIEISINNEKMDDSDFEVASKTQDSNQHYQNQNEFLASENNNTFGGGGCTTLLEDVRSPTRLFDESQQYTPTRSQLAPGLNETITIEKPKATNEMLETTNSNQTLESNFGISSIQAPNFSIDSSTNFIQQKQKNKIIPETPAIPINQTSRWTKLDEAFDLIKNIKNASSMKPNENNDEIEIHHHPINGDSIIQCPTTPKPSNISCFSVHQDIVANHRFEEPTYPESFFDNGGGDKENNQSTELNNSTLMKSTISVSQKVYQLSRLDCVNRRFAPDKAFYIEQLCKQVGELRNMVKNLEVNLPNIDDLVAEYLIYDEVLVIPYYKTFIKIAILKNDFEVFNCKDENALAKHEAFQMIEEKLEEVSKCIEQIKNELKMTSFTFAKFISKKTDFLVELSKSDHKTFETHQNQVVAFKDKYENLKAKYNQKMVEMTQKWQNQFQNENKRTEKIDKQFSEIMLKLEGDITNVLAASSS